MIFSQLEKAYGEVEELKTGSRPAIPGVYARDKYLELGAFLKNNQAALLQDLIANREHISLFRKIEQLNFNVPPGSMESIRSLCATLQLKALLRGSDGEKLANWVRHNKEGFLVENGLELFADLSKARQMLLERRQLMPNISAALSDIVTVGLGLKGVKEIQTVRAKYPQQTEILVHWINSEKIPLAKLQLSNAELATIAPHLHYVNCIDLKLNDVKQFIQSCSNAHELLITDPTIQSLDHLPEGLQKLDCRSCANLTNIDISRNFSLKYLSCMHTRIKTLDLSNNPQFETLHCDDCPYLQTPNFSNNRELRTLTCTNCTSFIALDLSKNLKLEYLCCGQCRQLASLGPSLPKKLNTFICSYCPRLTQLPQVSPKATVYSEGSPCGPVIHFKVSPQDLEEKPREVLLNLSKTLLDNKPLPNIIFIDRELKKPIKNIELSDIRRNFIATLCQNLFKEGSHFTSIEFGNTYMPTLRRVGDLDALRTFARVIGVAAITDTPIPIRFFQGFFPGVFLLKNQNIADMPIEPHLPTEELQARLRAGPSDMDHTLMLRALGVEAATLVVAKELQAYLGAERFKEFGDNIDAFMAKIQGTPV